MKEVPCGCCEGVHAATPEPVANPPALSTLRYRVGTHASFLATMRARLSAADLPGLAGLTSRDPGDPAVALLDGWASVAHVLAFYQERIANEGYLRTATERRSIVELARLVGYEPRPGVAASTHLAFRLEEGHDEVIARGTKVQSVPAPGALPQVYETSEPLPARAAFNELRLRMGRPQAVGRGNLESLPELWLAGTATRLQPNDGVLLVLGEGKAAEARLRLVDSIDEDHAEQRTRVRLQGGKPSKPKRWAKHAEVEELLDLLAHGEPASGVNDPRPPSAERGADVVLRLLQLQRPELADLLYPAWSGAVATKPDRLRVYAMRVKAALFGHNAPRIPVYEEQSEEEEKEAAEEGHAPQVKPMDQWEDWEPRGESDRRLYLDNPYPAVVSGGIVVVVPPGKTTYHGLDSDAPVEVDVVSRSEYGLSAKTTLITFYPDERHLGGGDTNQTPGWDPPTTMEGWRHTVVYAADERLDLADEPVTSDVCRTVLEMDELYEGLEAGRRLVVTGERADLPGVAGVTATELVTVAEVRHGLADSGSRRRGDRNHTFVILAAGGLRHCYVRATVKVLGNVVHATHGDSRAEVLGSGDASVAHQTFALRASPLTYVSAPTPSGVQSSLEVLVDDVRWPARPWLTDLGPADRGYLVRTDERQGTVVVGADGVEGRRFPTGHENVRARYRSGVGASGNTGAGRITLPMNKPLSVREVTNPVPATGGADPESDDQARDHAPLPLKTLDRLVSRSDYAAFSRTFAGVGKAAADWVGDGRRRALVVTVAGAAGMPLDAGSDVVGNLRRALRRFGDPTVPVKVVVAARLVLRLAAVVQVHPDHDWGAVGPRIRRALLEAFGFDRRDLGDDAAESAVVACIHSVPGVLAVDLDDIGSEPAGGPLPAGYRPARRVIARGARFEGDAVVPAEHLYLAPELPELLVLKEATA